MEASGVVLRQPLRFTGYAPSSCSKELKNSSHSILIGRERPKREVLLSGFCDQGHLQYYNSRVIVKSVKLDGIIKEKGVKKMKKKKQLKLLKGLSRDLSTFTQIGFGLDCDRGLIDQINGNMISEAAEQLLEQLQKLKAEEKELKRKMKEEKRRLKAANTCQMSSSSSSSESSDSDCGQVVNMKSLKNSQKTQNSSQQVIDEAISSYPTPIIPTITLSQPEETISLQIKAPCDTENECRNSGNLGYENENSLQSTNCSKKIEVCMGGKCKKSGAATLLEEFQRVVGIEGAVSGCKCMGKCRDGPNIKVLNDEFADNSSTNSLCVGVGLEDVSMIVANFLGENSSNQMEFAAVS